jgi:hypothetical protein
MTSLNHSAALRALKIAFAHLAIFPSGALAQTEACSFSNVLAEQCSDLDPNVCADSGGVPLGPGTRCPISSGTVFGDLNGDSDVNLLDIDPFTLALIDPAGYAAAYPNGNINLADLNHDGVRSGLDIAVLVVALLAPPPPCKFKSYYAYASKSASATGCSAYIDSCPTTLCGEPSAVSPAASAAWAGVGLFTFPAPPNPPKLEKWAQTGYTRQRSRRPPQIAIVTVVRYAETRAGPQSNDYEFSGAPPDPGTHKYSCHLVSQLLGTWQYEYDDEPWYSFTRPGWVDQKGNRYQFAAEIWNKQDQLVGTEAAKCSFSQCQFDVSYGNFQDTNIVTADLHTSDVFEWEIERVSATAFRVWDVNP